jgi:hypothetical protein
MDFPKSYLRLNESTLRKKLATKKLPMGYAENLISQVMHERHKKFATLARDTQHARLWSDLIAPAKAERRIVQRMLTLKLDNPSPERALALEAYLMVLDAIIGRLVLKANTCGETPARLAEGTDVPNKGEHWTDWMPKKKIDLIKDYFAAIPYTKGVRQKTPFERRIPQTQHAIHKRRLIERTDKEMALIERRMAAELADAKLTDTHIFKQQEIKDMRLQLSRMQAAMHTIKLLRPTDFVPVTWHGIELPD